MSDFFDLNTGGATVENESVGGFSLPESNVYKFKVKQAYADKYASGSKFVSVTLELEGKQEHTERLLISNSKGDSFYTDKKDKPQEYPGVTRFYELLHAAGLKGMNETGAAPGKIRAWDSSARAFTLQSASIVLHALKDAEGLVAIEKVEENKQVKGDSGYYKTNEKVEAAYIRKFSRLDKVTKIEEAKQVNPPIFMDTWKERHAGRTGNTFKEQANAPKVGMPPAVGGSTANDLFND